MFTNLSFKKILFIALSSLLIANAAMAAVICPTVTDIKNSHFNGWLPLYIGNDELASKEDIEKFKASVNQFVIARWDRNHIENAHCFYQGADPIVDKISFAHDAKHPEQNVHWVWVTPNILAECYAQNVQDCEFI
jgi:hypothetical protein